MISLVRRNPLFSYCALAIAISWAGILAVIRMGAIPAAPAEAERLFVRVYLAMLAGPSIAGVLMTAIVDGRTGLGALGQRLTRWQVAPVWYAVALLTAPVILALTTLVLAPFSGDFVPAVLGGGAIDSALPLQAGSVTTLLLLGVLVGLGAGFFEELGWTGFATPLLLRRLTALSTGILLGIVWGGWHFLAIYWGSAASFGDVPVALYMLAALFTFLPPYRVLMVRVYERTQSLLIAILMHTSLTASMIILGPLVTGTNAMLYNVTFAAILWVCVAAVSQSSRVVHRGAGLASH